MYNIMEGSDILRGTIAVLGNNYVSRAVPKRLAKRGWLWVCIQNSQYFSFVDNESQFYNSMAWWEIGRFEMAIVDIDCR